MSSFRACEGRDASYISTQLNKRIEARALEGVKVSVINNVVYLEAEKTRYIAEARIKLRNGRHSAINWLNAFNTAPRKGNF